MTAAVELKLEVVQVPVSDVDRAKAFYAEQVGFNADHDRSFDNGVRVVQLTPPGSACSIAIGTGLSSMTPGSVEGLQLVVSDMAAARAGLVERGVEIREPVEMGGFLFASFRDPDGNGWIVQEIRPDQR